MKILQVINVRWYNATAWYALFQGRLLQEHGHNVVILALPGTPAVSKAQAWGLPVRTLDVNSANPFKQPGLYQSLRALIREERPDIVNCHRGEGFLLFGLLQKRLNTFRLVRTRGDQRPAKSNVVNRWLYGNVADAVITTNNAMRQHLLTALRLPPEKTFCIRGGADTRLFRFDPMERERVRHEFGYTPDHTVIGLVGRFDRVKGQLECIQALAELKQRGHRYVRLLLVGFETATTQDQVTRWIREHGLQAEVRITGYREDISACLAALDIGVVSSLWSEAIARCAFEIMACGRPLLGTSVGVLPDLLSPKALVPPGDAGALSQRLEQALTTPKFLEELLAEQRVCIAQHTETTFYAQSITIFDKISKKTHS